MARPKLPPEQRSVVQSFRLTPDTADYVCRYALRRQIPVSTLVGQIIERVFVKQKTHAQASPCYGQTSSTLGSVLSESPSSRAERDAAPRVLR